MISCIPSAKAATAVQAVSHSVLPPSTLRVALLSSVSTVRLLREVLAKSLGGKHVPLG